jgi:SAM-dependent methyltransferase
MAKASKRNIAKTIPRVAVDFGCGQTKITTEYLRNNMQVHVDKVVGVDIAKLPGVDHVHDLTKFPYTFLKDGSVDAIFTSHFFEHLDGPQRAKFMDECYRILKPGGRVRHIHPYGWSSRFFQDFTHAMPPLVEASYFYFNKVWRQANKLDHYPVSCDFVGLQPGTAFSCNYLADADFGLKNPEMQQFMLRHYKDAVNDIVVDLVKNG